MGPSRTKVATGNISPARFVVLSTTDDKCTQASGTSVPIYGISGRGVRRPPLAGLDDGYNAILNESVLIYGSGDKDCVLELGGTVTADDALTSDANGKGVTTTTTGQFIGARAMEGGVSGDLVRVEPLQSYQY